MGTWRFSVDSHVGVATWRQVRVCFLCSLGSIELMSGCHIAKISCRGKGGCLAECLLTSTVLSKGKGLGHLLRGCG